MEDSSDTILYAKDMDTALSPAGAVKIMTCLLALENSQLTDQVTMTETGVSGVTDGGAHISSQLGEVFTMEQCLYALMLASANDIALQVAEQIGGSVDAFVQKMNDRAKELGCNNFVLFSNTPPVQYTYNGKGFSARGGLSNLKPEHYGDFAGYMADVAARYTGEGYHISHISPVNEPQYNWDSGQEGSGWTNDEVAALARELDMSLDDRGLSTDILLGESGDWEYLYKVKGDANRSNIFSAFFTPGSSAYVGDLAHVKNLICGHSYWTCLLYTSPSPRDCS